MHSPSTHQPMLISGNSNPAMWQEISDHIGIPLTRTVVSRFSDGEVRVQIDESVRNTHCFILQSTSHPVNEHLMELLILIDALRRASARSISAVIPYYGYARQDKKVKPREPITARLVANLIENTGARRVLAMDLHSSSIQGFFDIPVDNLTAANLLCDQMYADGWADDDCVMISPDVGGVLRTKYVADRLHLPIAIIAKRRSEPNKSEVMELVGNVKGKRAIMYDDMIDTAGSVCNGATRLLEQGATAVRVFATHGIFSGEAVTRIKDSAIDIVTVTNTIPQRDETKTDKIRYLSVAPIFGEAIRRIHMGMSITGLFR